MVQDLKDALGLRRLHRVVERREQVQEHGGRQEHARADDGPETAVPDGAGDEDRSRDEGGDEPDGVADAVGELFAGGLTVVVPFHGS